MKISYANKTFLAMLPVTKVAWYWPINAFKFGFNLLVRILVIHLQRILYHDDDIKQNIPTLAGLGVLRTGVRVCSGIYFH